MPPRIATVEIQPASGLDGAIDARVDLRGDNDRLLLTQADLVLRAEGPGKGQVIVSRGWLTWPQEALEVARNGDFTLNFTIPLSRDQIQAIEEHRAGGRLQLSFGVALSGAYLDSNQRGPAFRFLLERGTVIEKSRWVEDFLPAFGHGRYELWEVRFENSGQIETLSAEYELLARALKDYNAGEYEDSYKDCRMVFETLRKRQDELHLESLVGKEEWNRATGYLSIALHSEREIPRKVVRADAEFALTMTRAILKRVSSALLRPGK